jgi:hypothetical protein
MDNEKQRQWDINRGRFCDKHATSYTSIMYVCEFGQHTLIHVGRFCYIFSSFCLVTSDNVHLTKTKNN